MTSAGASFASGLDEKVSGAPSLDAAKPKDNHFAAMSVGTWRRFHPIGRYRVQLERFEAVPGTGTGGVPQRYVGEQAEHSTVSSMIQDRPVTRPSNR